MLRPKAVLNLWNKAYPVQADLKYIILVALGVGAFIWLFLQFFQPFGIISINAADKGWILAGYGGITTLVMLLHGTWLYFYMTNNPGHEIQWTVGRQISYTMSQITFIAIANFFYSTLAGVINFSLHSFLFYTGITFAIGLFPIIALVLMAYILHLRKHLAAAAAANKHLDQHPTPHKSQL